MIQQFHFLEYIEGNENTLLNTYLHPHIHSIIIYNSQDMETIQVFINRCMDKEVLVYNGILFSHKKGNPVIGDNMDGP